MTSPTENLTDKVEKLPTDPIYDTNWCDMPDDVKLECIGKMKLGERLSLRCTAKAERSLVDSQKIEFNKSRLWGTEEYFAFDLYRQNEYNFLIYQKISGNINKTFLIKFIKEVGVFENLEIFLAHPLNDNEQLLFNDGMFTVKNIKFEECSRDNMIGFLRNVKDGVESIKIDACMNISDDFAEILAISQIQNVPYWHTHYYDQNDSLHKVAQMWIDTDSKIGSTFQASVVLKNGSFEEFMEHFGGRILSKNDKRVRIRTNNPDRHILLERGLDDYVKLDFDIQFFRMMVISAKTKESEYDDNCKEWICKMASGMHILYNGDIHYYDDHENFDIVGVIHFLSKIW